MSPDPASDETERNARPLPIPTDPELVSACRAGDAVAWDRLIARYERLVYSVAIRNGLAPDDAADVCQATFVAFLESIDVLRDDTQVASWLMTVARRQSWRLRRRHERETLVAEVPEHELQPFDDWDRVADLHEALGVLGEPCRSVVIGLYFDPDAPTYAQLASRLGRSIGGIGPLRGRCLERLRNMLDDRGSSVRRQSTGYRRPRALQRRSSSGGDQ